MMAASQPSSTGGVPVAQSSSTGGAPVAQEYIVRVPKENNKRHSILKFHHSLKIDLTKSGPVRMERENNLKEYKLSHDMDAQPKFGAGSEFGREQREEARRRKYGIYRRQYNPDDQPWLMKLGEGKSSKRFKGVKEGGISENVAYYVFTQNSDGSFEAYPVDDWYHFTPQIKYKPLSSEEAEEEFSRRDKTLNYFSIMVKKRLKNEDLDDLDEEKETSKSKKGKKKDFLLTDLDDWAVMSDGDVEDGSDEDISSSDKSKKKKGKGKGKGKKSMKKNSDDEALEESDSFDEGQEVDYMTDSESNDEDMYEEKGGDEAEDKYKETGVEDEDALRKLIDSDEEEEEGEAEKREEEEEEGTEDATTTDKKDKKEESDSESSASSDSESDPEKDVNFSALFMQKKQTERKKLAEAEKNRSRSATPTEEKAKKRKAESLSPVPRKADTDSPASKKVKVEPTLSPSSSSASLASEGISEDTVRRYLMRKPMTTKDLVQKFKNTGLSKEQLVNSIAKILKRLDPEKKKIKDKLYLSIKKPE